MTGAAPPVRLIAAREAAGARIDAYLARCLPDSSRSQIQAWIRAGAVRADGVQVRSNHRLRGGEALEITPPEAAASGLAPSPTPLEIVHRDDDLLVLVKPAGLVVHPGAGTHGPTLVNALLALEGTLSSVGGVERPGIVHRLDKGTSGLMVIARNDRAHRALSRAFQERRVLKEYRALCWGVPRDGEGIIDLPLGRDPVRRTTMSSRGARRRSARTRYRVQTRYPGFALLELVLETGRTHQIRAHLKSLGHPVVGDRDYGGAGWRGVRDPELREALRSFDRLALHAYRLGFPHPATDESLEFVAELPDEFRALLALLPGDRR